MAISAAFKTAIEEVIKVIMTTKSPRRKRPICEMFMDLPDRDAWSEYYQVIPQPRCLSGTQAKLQQNDYKSALEVYEDLRLVFLNAKYYNEEGSQIWKDADTLQGVLDTAWRQHSILPVPQYTPPPTAPQKAPKAKTTPTTSTPVPPQPAAPPLPQPIASTSKPLVPIRPKSPPRPPSPDVDVDIGGGTPEPEDHTDDVARDEQSDDIVRQLEKGLPRWEGFSEQGWLGEAREDWFLEILHAIKSHKDVIGNRPAASLEAIPEEWPVVNTPYTQAPLSLKLIESRCRSSGYPTGKAFDMEMEQLFLKGRRWYDQGSDKYGHILLLQRLYQALTSSSPPSGPPYISSTNFASLRAGPGMAKPLHSTDTEGVPGVTTFRVSTKDRTFVDEVHYKGWTMRLADFLHLSNPDDPSRPIVGQIFKCFVSDEPARKGQLGLTVCWYYRPEQTYHPSVRQFWEGEVFKTSHFADHPLEDVIEKIGVQFTARHIRGRPRGPFWYPGWPLYVCDSRYNDRERVFVKIKNWNSCVPEEVRKNPDFMPIYPFERMVFPRRFGSPFLKGKGVKGPGGIGESVDKVEGERNDGAGTGTGRKRPRRAVTASTVDQTGPNKGLYVGVPGTQAAAATSSTSQYQYAQAQYASHQPQVYPRSQSAVPVRSAEDRSVVVAAGGWQSLGNNAVVEKLPAETAKHFDRDPETNEVLWFSGPPMAMAHTPKPRYSLAYLHHLAKKRKASEAMDVDEPPPARAPLTMTETVGRLLEEVLGDA
ncbi:hypothetical protein JAAARDRAFT_80856 [Jaapia argillacea MUCL 33604]|uniref:BAH domain-containing protein n=1 Tax=Jaapia argillacea MUCL 33604 TaxID=933084 RepID=A0A067PDZ1_9AGAM|nr:hypothetical protein JAAARDRAFT_80856 [Jaapia argillacea MUCL 33604]